MSMAAADWAVRGSPLRPILKASQPMEQRHRQFPTERRIRRRLVLALLGVVSLGEGRLGAGLRARETDSGLSRTNLSKRVDAVLKTPGYANGHWGILVVDRKTGQPIYERDADQLFAPASVTKLFSTAAALVELGPNFRFQTPVVRRGEIDSKGTLNGDLILIAQGDLAMGGRTGPDGTLLFRDEDHTYANGNLRSEIVPTDPLAGLEHIAREVYAAGIHSIKGEVIVDDRLFARAQATGSGPSAISPMVVNDSVIDILAVPAAKVGDPALVTFQPVTQFVTMDAQVATVEAGQPAQLEVEAAGPWRVAVRGQLPVGHSRVVKVYEIDDPPSFARALLIEALRRHGVKVATSHLKLNEPGTLPPRAEVARLSRVAEYTSPPFREFLRVILKVSHNLHASTLPLLLAARHDEHTLAAGLVRQGSVLKGLGIDLRAISFGGGAGGSRADLVTPRATVTLLRACRPDPISRPMTRPCRSSAGMERSPNQSPRIAPLAAMRVPRPGRFMSPTTLMAKPC